MNRLEGSFRKVVIASTVALALFSCASITCPKNMDQFTALYGQSDSWKKTEEGWVSIKETEIKIPKKIEEGLSPGLNTNHILSTFLDDKEDLHLVVTKGTILKCV